MTVEAIYEGGVFKPVAPVSLAEGTHVRVTISTEREPADPKTVARLLAEIAALPLQGSETFSGEDHDAILYGRDRGV